MKQIYNLISIVVIAVAFASCQEKYDMIPVPEPPETPEVPEGPEGRFETIYFVGSYTDWGFEPMRSDALNPDIFRYGRELKGEPGEFKFGTASGSWDNHFHPSIADAPYTHSEVVLGEDAGDLKWKMRIEDNEGAYKMVLNVTEGEESFHMEEFTPYSMIYMVGAAAPSGWTIDEATPLEAVGDNPYKFTWTGTLNAGELKFTCDRQPDWGGAFFLAFKGDLEPDGTEQQMRFSASGDGGSDDKWKISESGIYNIELDQLQETVIITKQ